ncbi:unnamed protein product [Chrysodeixis includens]|uniref:Serpin domain-containing protein n=1 Tax=Chrysodeixis includens TaxID=689277 RepID=A0A9P0FZ09_CHRIL|nr:unnamed protein product [Chrysodeixis includens]
MCYVRYEPRMYITIFLLQVMILNTRTDDIPIYNIQHVGHMKQYPLVTSLERINKHYCLLNNKWVKCSTVKVYNTRNTLTTTVYEQQSLQERNPNMKSFYNDVQPLHTWYYLKRFPGLHGRPTGYPVQIRHPGFVNAAYRIQRPEQKSVMNDEVVMPHINSHAAFGAVTSTSAHATRVNTSSAVAYAPLKLKPSAAEGVHIALQHLILPKNMSSIENFAENLDAFERQFYMITFNKLTTISPPDRQENGMSFVQSGFFLLLTLMALSTEVDSITKGEIDKCIGFNVPDVELLGVVRHFLSMLPESTDKLKLKHSSRLMLWPGTEVKPQFRVNAASALDLNIDKFNGTETPEQIAYVLNNEVELDSGGAIRDTFDEEDVTGGVTAVFVTTLYVRGSWRTAPTVLNGSRVFHDHEDAPKRTVRMIKINDIMAYADLKEWDAEVSHTTDIITNFYSLIIVYRQMLCNGQILRLSILKY